MLKMESKNRLARIAINDVCFGGARAMAIAGRMQDTEGESIVYDIYSGYTQIGQQNPYAIVECAWCGVQYLLAESEYGRCCSGPCAIDYNN